MQKNKLIQPSWQPTASLAAMRQRATLYRRIRTFFAEREILEVETPLLCSHTVTEPNIESLACANRFCQTSPEYAMKRLLAAGSGPIYQITKAFRQEELGRFHNPEFTMLEWYRPQFSHLELMQEIKALMEYCLDTSLNTRTVSYQALFIEMLDIDPLSCRSTDLQQLLNKHHITLSTKAEMMASEYLNILFSQVIEPNLPADQLVFVYDFPRAMASLAKESANDPRVAHRFECYYQNMELANGFYELADSQEQRRRFEADNLERRARGQQHVALDEFLLAALASGFPDCSGVALGLDRLLMIICQTPNISDVLCFPWDHC